MYIVHRIGIDNPEAPHRPWLVWEELCLPYDVIVNDPAAVAFGTHIRRDLQKGRKIDEVSALKQLSPGEVQAITMVADIEKASVLNPEGFE